MTNYIKQAKKRFVKEFGGNPVMMQEQVWEYHEKEYREITKQVAEILWMARRYADGRLTYAPQMFNDAYDALKELLGDGVDLKPDDATVSAFPYAFNPYDSDNDLDDARSGFVKARGRSSVSDDSEKSIKKRKK